MRENNYLTATLISALILAAADSLRSAEHHPGQALEQADTVTESAREAVVGHFKASYP